MSVYCIYMVSTIPRVKTTNEILLEMRKISIMVPYYSPWMDRPWIDWNFEQIPVTTVDAWQSACHKGAGQRGNIHYIYVHFSQRNVRCRFSIRDHIISENMKYESYKKDHYLSNKISLNLMPYLYTTRIQTQVMYTSNTLLTKLR